MSNSTQRNVAEYRWEDTTDDGNKIVYEKWIVVSYEPDTDTADEDEDEGDDELTGDLTVTFGASEQENTTLGQLSESFDDWQDRDIENENNKYKEDSKDEKTFEWERFVDLVNAINGPRGEPGPKFVENVFVGGRSGPAAVGNQATILGENPTVAGLESRPAENGDYLHVYYQTKHDSEEERLSMQWVQSDSRDELPDNTGSVAGDYYYWQVRDHELQKLLVEDPDTDANTTATRGFSREFREALFLNPRRHKVIGML